MEHSVGSAVTSLQLPEHQILPLVSDDRSDRSLAFCIIYAFHANPGRDGEVLRSRRVNPSLKYHSFSSVCFVEMLDRFRQTLFVREQGFSSYRKRIFESKDCILFPYAELALVCGQFS
ncbi:hypothetical protein TNCV_3808061 [Trichonephila clavipes]|nr:hypothetical protein TNCV_3808061 [Trichonephila clavipes]